MKYFTVTNGKIFFLVMGAVCLLAFQFIGGTVDAEGVLHEPFALLPLGYLFLLIGVVLGLFGLLRAAFRWKGLGS
ncbi:MAG: DUF3955 domain-containing protein [Candidatus Thiothrix putei]|uniref:DUF3955 domain-containing protein n=1 Tax=Candidatus Thiothrix putei TaxID=3080811 RepID=A0AA95HEC3_9GAMM|nr:MAG: DUF3955 domain-containing protein [Candidatus Thiothrix putei]